MPAFTFEKISSPVRSTTKSVTITGKSKHVTVKRSRSFIIDMMDRLAAARIARDGSDETSTPPHKRPPPD